MTCIGYRRAYHPNASATTSANPAKKNIRNAFSVSLVSATRDITA
jgi:hypothetical protein